MKKAFFFGLLALVFAAGAAYFDRRPQAIYGGDAAGYWSHLPAFWLHGDIGDYSKTIAAWQKNHPPIASATADDIGFQKTPTGQRYIKYPLGTPLLQSPFFLAAAAFCKLTGRFEADGWSPPFVIASMVSANFYGLWGLFLLFLALKRPFPSQNLRFAVTAAIGLGSNLFYQLTYNPGMAHQYAFFLFALLVWLIERREGRFSMADFLKMGLVSGLLFLTRHTDGLCVLLPALWGLEKIGDLKSRFLDWLKNWRGWAVFAAAFLTVASIQSFYWLRTSGQFWFDGYQNEEFHFRHPRILDGIFGFTNGWLVYSPIMIFSVLGLFWLKKPSAKSWFWPAVALLGLHVWVIFSWWCWQYVNGFGLRAMIDVYPVLAFSMAAFFAAFWQKRLGRAAIWTAILGFVGLNFFQNWQQFKGIMWTEEANKAFYFSMFGQTKSNAAALIGFDSNARQPAADGLRKSRDLAFSLAETEQNQVLLSEKHRFSNRKSFRCSETEFALTTAVDLEKEKLEPSKSQWLRVSVRGFMPEDEPFCWNRDRAARLVVETRRPDEAQPHFSRSIRIGSKIGNPDWSIWNNGAPGQWGEAAFFVRLPSWLKKGSILKAYVWNPHRQNLYADELRVELFDCRD